MTSQAPLPCEIRAVTTGQDLEHLRTLLREYTAHLRTVIDPILLKHRESELTDLAAHFAPPHGALLLALSSGQPVGCAALRPITLPDVPSAAEFCRLWVTPSARGRDLGSQLLQAAINIARAAGHNALVLNSHPTAMRTAQSLYARAGFMRIPPYKFVAIPDIEFFRLDLTL